MTANMNIACMIDALNKTANEYEGAIDDLITATTATSSVDMSNTVVATTNVSLHQSVLEMVQGSVKQVIDQVKKQGSNISR